MLLEDPYVIVLLSFRANSCFSRSCGTCHIYVYIVINLTLIDARLNNSI